MTTELQLKISSDPRLVSFIRQYPIWYKRLNRNPLLFKDFILFFNFNLKLDLVIDSIKLQKI